MHITFDLSFLIGNLRFKAPVPKEPWDGVKDGSQDGKACLQVSLYIIANQVKISHKSHKIRSFFPDDSHLAQR